MSVKAVDVVTIVMRFRDFDCCEGRLNGIPVTEVQLIFSLVRKLLMSRISEFLNVCCNCLVK